MRAKREPPKFFYLNFDFIQALIAGYHECGDEYWALDPVSEKCFYYSGDKLSWNNANISCMESDSSLVTIDSAAKSAKLLSFSKYKVLFRRMIGYFLPMGIESLIQ